MRVLNLASLALIILCITPVHAAVLCEACDTTEDCTEEGAECMPTDDGNRCGQACSASEPCPPGYSCQEMGYPSRQCFPDTNSCICDGTDLSLSRECEVLGPTGEYSCLGYQDCEVTGWGPCILPEEECNGLDDDCNGDFDEGFGDWDGDRFGEACDCAPYDSTTYPGASEVNDGQDNHCPGDEGHGLVDEITGECGFHNALDRDEYSCDPLQDLAEEYEQIRWTEPDLTGICEAVITTNALWIDTEPLINPGDAFYYLTRAINPHAGSWGKASSGIERITSCP